MRRPSREKKREERRPASPAAPAAVPIDVHVPAAGPGTGTASIGGVPVAPAAGEAIQNTVLRYLHRIALATGHPVHATVHDERIGYVVPLRVCVDGASRYEGEPVRTGEPWATTASVAGRPAEAVVEAAPAVVAEQPSRIPVPAEPPAPPQAPRRDRTTHVLRAVPESAAGTGPTPQPRTPVHTGPRPRPQRRPEFQQRSESPSPAQPEPQPRREPGTMRLSAVQPTPTAEPTPASESAASGAERHASPAAPEQPKREPSTLPLSAVKPVSAGEAKREARTMPLRAATQGESAPAAGGAVPSTFVLRAVPEPKDGPLAQPARTPGLPLTLPGIPVVDGHTPPAPEPAHTMDPVAPSVPEPLHDAGSSSTDPIAPAAHSLGTVSPPTGEFGPVMDPTPGPELAQSPAQSTPPGQLTPPAWQQGPATPPVPPQHTSKTPASGPVSLEPQPWPPNQSSAPAHAPAQPTDAVPPYASAQAPAHPTDVVAPYVSKPISLEPQSWPPAAPPTPVPASMPAVTPAPPHEVGPESAPAADTPRPLAPPEESAAEPYSAPEGKVAEDPGPKPTPVREFDAVAEAVLDPGETNGGAATPFAEPMSRINEAVKLGRINEAAEMAEQTVAQATAALGPQHPEVLRLRELTAYIAYLAGDALRSFHLSLDLAALRHRLDDPRAAYGNIQSAAAAWRAVRDPLQGLHLGRDLIAVWTDLAADAGPAADDLDQLEKARTRMGRLAERARVMDAAAYAGSPAHGQ